MNVIFFERMSGKSADSKPAAIRSDSEPQTPNAIETRSASVVWSEIAEEYDDEVVEDVDDDPSETDEEVLARAAAIQTVKKPKKSTPAPTVEDPAKAANGFTGYRSAPREFNSRYFETTLTGRFQNMGSHFLQALIEYTKGMWADKKTANQFTQLLYTSLQSLGVKFSVTGGVLTMPDNGETWEISKLRETPIGAPFNPYLNSLHVLLTSMFINHGLAIKEGDKDFANQIFDPNLPLKLTGCAVEDCDLHNHLRIVTISNGEKSLIKFDATDESLYEQVMEWQDLVIKGNPSYHKDAHEYIERALQLSNVTASFSACTTDPLSKDIIANAYAFYMSHVILGTQGYGKVKQGCLHEVKNKGQVFVPTAGILFVNRMGEKVETYYEKISDKGTFYKPLPVPEFKNDEMPIHAAPPTTGWAAIVLKPAPVIAAAPVPVTATAPTPATTLADIAQMKDYGDIAQLIATVKKRSAVIEAELANNKAILRAASDMFIALVNSTN